MATGFDRDFGYLLPFLDRVISAASDHPDAQVRTELAALLADEPARWARVRELLRARPGVARIASAPTLEATEATQPAPSPPAIGAAVGASTQESFPKVLTVGNLRSS